MTDPENEVVERVARIFAKDNAACGDEGAVPCVDPASCQCWQNARAAIAAMPSPWRDISSAPRDGTRIMVYRPDAKKSPYNEHTVVGTDYWSDRYSSTPCWSQSRRDEQPTHWMPLPAPPET